VTRDPVHRRTIDIDVFEDDDCFDVVARLRDERPWADGREKVRHLHDMTLTVSVRRSDLTIVAAKADMRRFPHAECPGIEPKFEELVGLSVARGYTRAVQERFGRDLGCTHLEFLARAIGPAVVQAIPSAATRAVSEAAAREELSKVGTAWLADTCHVWRTGGPGQRKIAAGWIPGRDEYPAPSAEAIELRRQAQG
jgi:hypothetical protein